MSERVQTWDAIEVGEELPPLVRETNLAHWNRYAAVNDEFIPMHMDPDDGRAAGQKDVFGMGNLRIAYLHNVLRGWLGRRGDIVAFQCQFRGFNFKGDELTARGKVTAKENRDGAKLVHLEMGVPNQEGLDTTPAQATVLIFDGEKGSTLPAPAGPTEFEARQASEQISQEVIDLLGTTTEPFVSHPVGANDIRRWALAVHYPEPAPAEFIDEAVAAQGPWGGMVAPREFNPFAWMPGRGAGRAWDLLTPGRVAINGGQRTTYYAPMRPGDVIAMRSCFADVYEKPGRRGPMIFVVNESRWTNQRDELVRIAAGTVILM